MDSSNKKPGDLSKILHSLKYASINPGNPNASPEMLKQLLTARRVLFLKDAGVPRGKRKYDELLQDTSVSPYNLSPKKPTEQISTEYEGQYFVSSSVSETTSGFVSWEKSNRIFPNQCCLHESTESWSKFSRESSPKIYSVQDGVWDWSAGEDVVLIQDSDDESTGKPSFPRDNVAERGAAHAEDVILIQDSDDDSTGILFFHHKDVRNWSAAPGSDVVLIEDSDDDSSGGSNKLNSAELVPQTSDGSVGVPEMGNTLPMRKISAILTSDGAVDNAEVLSPNRILRRSSRLINYIGDHLRRQVVPLGTRYQADIPTWSSTPGFDHEDSSKWLGEKVWPSDSENTEISMKMIGKGRPEALCLCDSPGSIECIQHHIHEKRRRLVSEIGDAFYRWGFDTMGETVSKSWTVKEQLNFKKLFKTKSLLSRKSFWRRAFKYFSFKCRESIVSYYFNVFVLRNLSRQTRLPCRVIDSDDDEGDETTQ